MQRVFGAKDKKDGKEKKLKKVEKAKKIKLNKKQRVRASPSKEEDATQHTGRNKEQRVERE